jgi:serine/threonine protein kinase
MSPEQVRGEAADPRSDVWALGVVLFEMLAKRRAFAGESRDDVHRAIVHDAPAPIAALRPELPQPLVAVIDGALAKDPAQRFQSAAKFAAALVAAQRSSPIREAVAATGVHW